MYRNSLIAKNKYTEAELDALCEKYIAIRVSSTQSIIDLKMEKKNKLEQDLKDLNLTEIL